MDADVLLRINGAAHEQRIDTRTTLLDLLREHLHLTGAKKGCDHGQCGACTVLVDGRRANACLLLAVACAGTEVTTIEGLDGHPLQQAFVEHDAFQCGYCTPGQIVSAVGLREEGWEDVAEGMSGNLCRCGAYPNIRAAVTSLGYPDSEGSESGLP